jgi:hypothetical protein
MTSNPPKAPKRKADSDPAECTTTSKDANNRATLSPSGFYNDEEVWIEIYYTLLAAALSRDQAFRPPPMTEILLDFNIFFQGYKQAVGTEMHTANAVTLRRRRSYEEFRAYIAANLGPLTAQFAGIAPLPRDANTRHFRPVISPALLADVMSGTKSLCTLRTADAQPDARPWLERAAKRVDVRGRHELGVHWTPQERHVDRHLNSHSESYGNAVWDPQGIIRSYRGHSYVMTDRHVDAAAGSALLFAAAVPPLGFNGDLRGLKEGDFDEAVVRAAKRQRLTAGEKGGWRVEEEDAWVAAERRLHEEGVEVVEKQREVARVFYERVEVVRMSEVKRKEEEAELARMVELAEKIALARKAELAQKAKGNKGKGDGSDVKMGGTDD